MELSSLRSGGKEFHDEIFSGEHMEETEWRKTLFESCRFEHCVFDTVKWRQCRFEQCVFQDCRLLNLKPESSRFHNVRFDRCKLAGLNFGLLDTALLFSVEIKDCMLLSCSFPNLDLRKSSFSGNEWEDCMFEDVDMRELDFSAMSFGGSRFRRCHLEKCSFVDATDFFIDPRENQLQGARFSTGSALELLKSFNIILE